MDRIISKHEIKSAQKRKITKISVSVFVIFATLYFLMTLLKPTLDRNEILLAKTFRGTIEETIFSIGTIVPKFEESIISPIESKINHIKKGIGSKVSKNESILDIDKTQISSDYHQLKDSYALTLNKKQQLKLRLERELMDLRSRLGIKELEIKSLKTKVSQQKKLFDIGAGSKENFRMSQLNLQIAEREFLLLKQQIINKESSLLADLNELKLEAQIQERKIAETKRKLTLATISSSLDGIVTWVDETIGKRINSGDVVAKVVQENSFKLMGELSETQASKLYIGQDIIFKLNDKKIRGTVISINPTVNDGVITYFAKIPNDISGLRANLKLDTHLVLSKKEDAILIKSSSFYTGSKNQSIFVVNGDFATKRMVEIGLSNFEFIELKSSVQENETIIISSTEAFSHLNKIDIN